MARIQIGDSGIFTLKDPFHTQLLPQTVYTCKSVRTLNDIVASGVDPYQKYYEPYQISKEAYLSDLSQNVCIVGLQASTSHWVYVPDTYIAQLPRTYGVKYSSIVLGIELGAVPDELNLKGLTDAIHDLVFDNLGVKPNIKAVLVAPPTLIDMEQHQKLEQARKAKIKQTETLFAQRNRLQSEVESLHRKIHELESYIKKVV